MKKEDNNSTKVFNIAIFASGTGSNTKKIIDHFSESSNTSITLVVSNNKAAGVLDIAAAHDIETIVITKNELQNESFKDMLLQKEVSLIVLAGFLLQIPQILINAFPGKMINIHPALLPKYGGKGMYGNFVHAAVLENNELQSGISIHLVDEDYDHGKLLFQATCPVDQDNVSSLSNKVHMLEHAYFPTVIENFINYIGH